MKTNYFLFFLKVIEEALLLLDNPASLEAYLIQEGQIYSQGLEGIQKQYLDVMGPVLFSALSPFIHVS